MTILGVLCPLPNSKSSLVGRFERSSFVGNFADRFFNGLLDLQYPAY